MKNGPALGGYGAIAMKDALTATMTTLPEQLRKTLTWDRGKELSAHAQFKVETGIRVFFADPHSPWQRGTNENTNGLLRQYFPKGTDLSRWSAEDLEAVALAINSRPRKVLGWKTPAEALDEQLARFKPVLQRPVESRQYTGIAFTLGLVLVLIAGSDLATGNMMLVPLSAMRRKIGLGDVAGNLALVLIGNLVGALFVAYFLAVQTGVIGHAGASGSAGLTYDRLAQIAGDKATAHSGWQTFLRGIGCNWLVCLAVWMSLAATTISGKILAIFFPIMAFVAMGFDHVVANMFFLPAAIFAGVPASTGRKPQ